MFVVWAGALSNVSQKPRKLSALRGNCPCNWKELAFRRVNILDLNLIKLPVCFTNPSKMMEMKSRLYKRFLASPWSFDSSSRIYLPDLFDRFSFYSSISPKLDVSNFQAWNTRENEAFTDYLSECNQRGAVKQCYLLATEGNYGCRFHEEF